MNEFYIYSSGRIYEEEKDGSLFRQHFRWEFLQYCMYILQMGGDKLQTMKTYTYILYLLTILVLTGSVTCQEWYEVGNPHFLDKDNVFDAIKETNAIKILKFFSPWCKYCRYIKTYMDNYKSSHEVSSNLKFYEFNCQSNGAMFCVQHFQVGSYPAVIIFNENGERVSRIDGLYPEPVIINILDQYNQKAQKLEKPHQQVKKQEQPKEQQPKQQEKPKTQQHEEQIKKQQVKSNEKKAEQQPKAEDDKHKPQYPKPEQNKSKESQAKPKQQQKKPPVQQNNNKAAKNKPKIQQQQKKQQSEKVNGQKTLVIAQKENEKVEVIALESNKIDPQKQTIPNEKQTDQQGSHWFKYLFYIAASTIGGVYAYRIFTGKKEQNKKPINPSPTQNIPIPQQKPTQNQGVTSRDVENEMLVQEVIDQNL